MLLYRYGIKFELVEDFNKHILLKLRNADHVRKNMVYQTFITEKDHASWFAGLDLSSNFYFLVYKEDTPVGVINIKDITQDRSKGELGIFFGDSTVIGTPLPVISGLSLIDIAVSVLHLRKLYTHVRNNRPDIVRFNERFGFRLSEEKPGYRIYTLDLEEHYRITGKIRQGILHLSRLPETDDSIRMNIGSANARSEQLQYLLDFDKNNDFPYKTNISLYSSSRDAISS